jgi:hypothetical protein
MTLHNFLWKKPTAPRDIFKKVHTTKQKQNETKTKTKRVLTYSTNNSQVWNIDTGNLDFEWKASHTLPNLSQDGTKFYYAKDSVVTVHDIDTNTRQTVTIATLSSRSRLVGIYLSPDNAYLFASHFIESRLEDVSGRQVVQFYKVSGNRTRENFETAAFSNIVFSPDGAYILYSTINATEVRRIIGDRLGLVLYRVEHSEPRRFRQSGAISNTHALIQTYTWNGVPPSLTSFTLVEHATGVEEYLSASQLDLSYIGDQLFSPDGSLAYAFASGFSSRARSSSKSHDSLNGKVKNMYPGRVYAFNEDNTLVAIETNRSRSNTTIIVAREVDGEIVAGPFPFTYNTRYDNDGAAYFSSGSLVVVVGSQNTMNRRATVYDIASGNIKYSFPATAST